MTSLPVIASEPSLSRLLRLIVSEKPNVATSLPVIRSENGCVGMGCEVQTLTYGYAGYLSIACFKH